MTPHPKEHAKPHHHSGKDMNHGHVKVMNIVTDSAQKPQLLKELEVSTKFTKFNKNSEEFIANVPNLNFNVANLVMPNVQNVNQQMAAGLGSYKDLEAASTNNFSNNMFTQTIYINPHAPTQSVNPYMDVAQSHLQPNITPQANYGLTVPIHPQASLPANILQNQMSPMAGMHPSMYGNAMMMNPQSFYMNQPPFGMNQMSYMQMMGGLPTEEDTFDNSNLFDPNTGEPYSEEQIQLMAMLEMFKDTLINEDEEVDIAIQEQEFEREQAEAEIFHPELKDCLCCKGYPLKCKADICLNLGTCHCALRKTKEEEEANKDKYYLDEKRDCLCCRGYVYACTGAACKLAGRCKCEED